MQQQKAQDQVTNLSLQLKDLNQQIHYTGQYLSNKKTYTAFLIPKTKDFIEKIMPQKFRHMRPPEIG